jgi:hypothetical protein
VINANAWELLGFELHYLDDDGTSAVIDTPFVFEDQDPLPVYVEECDGRLRIWDDGGVIDHFDGELETWADRDRLPAAFAQYLAALVELVCWEREFNSTIAKRRAEYLATGTPTSRLENFLHSRTA